MISELKIANACFAVMNVYMSMRYALSLVNIVHDYEGSLYDQVENLTTDQIFARILYVMDFIGIGFNVILLGLFSVVSYFVYLDMMNFIILHLDGNRTMWHNFREITHTRGILKLDILANLEFFSSFSFILFRAQINLQPSVWGTLLGLFMLSIFIQLYGGYGTITTANNCYYRTYFTLRFIVELMKLMIVIMLPADGRILWQKIDLNFDDGDDGKMSNQYIEFIAFVSLSMIFTLLTTVWSTLRIREAQTTRRRNQSEQIKAMWRIEETHFNPKMNSNYMMKADNDSAIGGFNS